MKRIVPILTVALVAGGLRLWKIDLAPFHDIDDLRDWERAGRVSTGQAPWWLGPDAAISTGKGARLPGGLYYLLLAGAHQANDSPLSGLVLVAILGTAAAVLTYPLAALFMPRGDAFLAAMVAATSPAWVLAARRIWNPNIVPLFSVLFFLFLGKWFLQSSKLGLILALAVAGLLCQLHLSALALLPLAGVLVITGLWRPRALIVGLILLAAPLAPFFAKDASEDWVRTRRLGEALQDVVKPDKVESPSKGLPLPVSWPLPYVPPLSACGYGDDFLDRHAARLLMTDSPGLREPGVLGLYWKGRLSQTVRSFRLQDLPAKLRLHRASPVAVRVKYGADTAVSLAVLILMITGFAVLIAEALSGDGKAGALLVMTVPLLVCTRFRGVSDSYHFYFTFFPLPALIIARAVSGMGGLWRSGRIVIIAVAGVSGLLLLDRTYEIEKLGGTPTYGVPYRYRAEAAAWLLSAGCETTSDVSVLGVRDPWTYLLNPGAPGPKLPKFRILEMGESALHTLCRGGAGTCATEWLAARRRLAPSLAHQSGGIWIYRIGTAPALPSDP